METRLTDMTCALPREAWVADCAFGEVPAKPAGGWRILDYTCKEYAGRMLTTCQPEAAVLTIPLGLTGWHAVSIGIVCFWCEGVLDVRLSGDTHWQRLRVASSREEPWIMADLTGRALEIKPAADLIRSHGQGTGPVASLMSVRATPLSDAHVRRIKDDSPRPLVYTNDGHGLFWSDPTPGPQTVKQALEPFADSDWRVCCFGVGGADLVNYPSQAGTLLGHGWDFPREGDSLEARMQEPLRQGWDALRQVVELTHEQKQECWVYLRPQAWMGNWPFDHAFRSRFYGQHQHCRCVEADGQPLAHLSFACPEVRQQLNTIAAEAVARGADGICIVLVRGFPLVRYEEAVCQRFREVYGGDARQRPDTDPELRLVWREFVERWLRELRAVLDAAGPGATGGRRKLTIISGANLEWNQRFGVDIADFARKGLLDAVLPYPYGLERYAAMTYQTIDVAEYARALAGTGVPVYPSLGDCNDHRRGLGEYFRRAHNYYQQGADGLSRWDTSPNLARIRLDSPARVALWSEIYQLAQMKQTQDCGVTFVDIGGIPQGPFQPTVGL
jgi:hypothetical protein